ncbi:hypothetical protein R3P38DRAFT_3198286 [Favolaschia claudopus]|uniref:Uncharacterized protein n=1 Tax=Favolaschia claudopus TaxID=2862362 RepID=A0AAW0B5B6_9AGAR
MYRRECAARGEANEMAPCSIFACIYGPRLKRRRPIADGNEASTADPCGRVECSLYNASFKYESISAGVRLALAHYLHYQLIRAAPARAVPSSVQPSMFVNAQLAAQSVSLPLLSPVLGFHVLYTISVTYTMYPPISPQPASLNSGASFSL